MKHRSDALRFLLALLTTLAFVWFVSTKEQQHQYLSWLGIADSTARDHSTVGNTSIPKYTLGFRSPGPTGSERSGTRSSNFSPIDHGSVGSPCISDGVAHPTRSSKDQIYRWVDGEGRTHFSDKPPDEQQSKVVGYTADGGVGMFSADYKYLGKKPPVDFQRSLERNIDGVFRMFDRALHLKDVAPLHVNITIIDGKQRFVRYRNKRTSSLATTSGYYSFSDNEAVVRWIDHARTLAVARHEISHLALGNWVGLTPPWFNEGLAEFMERLEFQQNYARAEAFNERIEALRALDRAGKLPEFRWFLSSKRSDWEKIGDDTAYAYAWSLVQFLIQDSQRQRLVSDYLNTLSDHRCQRFDHSGFFATHYEGGLQAFENEWRRWLVREIPIALHF